MWNIYSWQSYLISTFNSLYPRWKEAETLQANLLQFSLDETQWQEDWAMLLSLASQPGSALEQMHVFTLAHILRRPIIVYGVKYVKSFRGEALGFARFEGKALSTLFIQTHLTHLFESNTHTFLTFIWEYFSLTSSILVFSPAGKA